MAQPEDNIGRPSDEEASIGHLGKFRFLAVLMVGFGLLILFFTEPPRGEIVGLFGWIMLALGITAVWLSYTRVGRDIAGSAEGLADKQNRQNS